MDQSTSQPLGHYTLKAHLGGTAMASVYYATDNQRPREVVVKVLRRYFSQEPGLTDQFFQEMERVRQLQHPQICQVYEARQAGDTCYVAMEYTPWESLRERFQRPLSPQEALAIFSQVAQAVEYAHSQGLSHRDLKPSNIFVGPDVQVLVSDFGMAVLHEGAEATMSISAQSSMAVYSAPEATQGAPVDPYTDIYSLGVLVYQLLTGIPPFSSLSPPTVLARQLTTTPPTPSRINNTLPPQVDQVVLQALARWPQGRFSSVQAFREAIEEALAPIAAGEVVAQVSALVEVSPEPLQEAGGRAGELTAQEVIEQAEQLIAQEPLYLVCSKCLHVNDASANRCVSCWSRLQGAQAVDQEEAERLLQAHRRARRRKRLLRVGVAVVALIALTGWLITTRTSQLFIPPVTNPTLSSNSLPGEWAMFRGDATRTGFASSTTFIPTGEVVWTFQTEPIQPVFEEDLALEEGELPNSPILASPAVVGGVVYLPTGDRRIVALRASTGQLLWEHQLNGPVNSSPAIAGDTVYFGLRDGRLLALDKANGELRWQFSTGAAVFASPAVHQGTVYMANADGGLYAIDATTGDLRWQFQADGWIFSSPAVNHAVIAFTTNQGELYILDRQTGAQRMAFDLKAPSLSSPAFHGNSVMVGAQTGTVWAVDWRQEQTTWERRWYNIRLRMFVLEIIGEIEDRKGFVWLYKGTAGRDSILSSAAAAQGKVFIGTSKGLFYALDAGSGKDLWEHTLGAQVFSSPVVAGNVVYIGANDNKVYGLNVNTGEQVWAFTTNGWVTANPVVANGMLYIPSQDGTLYAIK